MSKTVDAIIVGAGQAGPSLAARLSAAGMTVAMIERHLFGGTCVNTGCTPTKTLVASAECAYRARHAAEYGVALPGPVSVNMEEVKSRKDRVVSNSRDNLEKWLRELRGCTVFRGHARFIAPHELCVGEERLSAERIFLNVGGRARIPDFPGVSQVPYLTNTSLLDLAVLPQHLLIVGGGYIGVEFAQMFRRFGSEVTIIEQGPRLLAHEDEDVSAAVESIFTAEGIAIRTAARCIRLSGQAQQIMAGVDCETGEPEVRGSHVLLAVGRRPNTDDLGAERVGLKLDERGYIVVDDQLRTSIAGVWALGDCNGKGAFTHTAYNDFEIVAANLLEGSARRVSDRIPCHGVFIDPPLGRAGLSETEARAARRPVLIGKRPMSRVSRAIEKGDTRGFMKIVVDADSRQILGAAILGVGGDEAVHAVLDIMSARAPYTTLQRTMHIHPTVAELLPTVLGELQR